MSACGLDHQQHQLEPDQRMRPLSLPTGYRIILKPIKQALKIGTFPGHSAYAVRWQVLSVSLAYVRLSFEAHISYWVHSITRLFTVVHLALIERVDMRAVLSNYGTQVVRLKCSTLSNRRGCLALQVVSRASLRTPSVILPGTQKTQ
jgi:hypothetical protein